MAWYLQTPDGASPKLLAHILAELGPGKKAGAAFAFASAQGVKLLAAESAFSKFLKAAEFVLVVGLDAITDTRALDELKKLRANHPNLKPKVFLHKTAGSIFHPKTMWLKTDKGGVIITGSGNLTSGGLKSNWEAMAIEKLSSAEIDQAEKNWDAWLKTHSKQLLEVDDLKAIERAKANKVVRSKIKKALKKPEPEDEAAEAEIDATVEEIIGEVTGELQLNPALIAEIPKASDRWEQANFDKKSFIEFFGVTLGVPKSVQLFNVQDDGSLVAETVRPPVAVKSRNFRFELSAAKGLKYPGKGVPIGVFERVSDTDFNYVLLMPGDKAHAIVSKFLDELYPKKTRVLRRVQITMGDLQKVWPDAPFFK